MPKTTVVNVKCDAHDVLIDRTTKWGNPFRLGKCGGSREQVIAKYREYILNKPELLAALHELRGKRLGCWCAPAPCHGDVLAEFADNPQLIEIAQAVARGATE